MSSGGLSRQTIGKWGEEQAALFLLDQGYEIVCQNYHARHGEIDIVAWSDQLYFGRTLCFIEVKTRAAGSGSAARAQTRQKMRNLFRAAQHYCMMRAVAFDDTPIQFEHVSVYGSPAQGIGSVQHFIVPIDEVMV